MTPCPCKNCITYALCVGENFKYKYKVPSLLYYLRKCSLLKDFLIERIEESYNTPIEDIYKLGYLFTEKNIRNYIYYPLKEIESDLNKKDLLLNYFDGFIGCNSDIGAEPYDMIIRILYYYKFRETNQLEDL